MKDILISATRMRREMITFAIGFALAALLNIVAISVYGTSWLELITQLPFVFSLAFGFYFLWVVLRIAWHFVPLRFKHRSGDK